MAEHYGLQTAAGHLTVSAESKEPYAGDVLASLQADAEQVIARYPQKRSALLPLLHLVQSVDGYVTGRGIDFCAEVLDLSTAEVSGVATFYTQYKRHPNGEYTVGVCTNTLCAIMGGDRIWDEVSDHLGIGHDETTADGKITLERVECNAACDFAPVVMANWEFFDNQTPESTKQLVDDLRAGKDVRPSRGPDKVCTFKQVSRTLAGFSDGLADQGVGAGPASLVGLELAHANGWTAPGEPSAEQVVADEETPAQEAAVDTAEAKATGEIESKAEEAAEEQAVEPETLHPTAAVERAEVTGAGVGIAPEVLAEAAHEEESRTAADDAATAAEEAVGEATPEGVLADNAEDRAIEAETEQPTLFAEAQQEPEPVPAPEPEPEATCDVDEATVARINLVARGGAGGPAYDDDDDAGATVSRSDLLAAAASQEKATDRGSHEDGGHGEGSAKPAADGSGPAGWDVKGNASSMLFHAPSSPWYRRTRPEVWFKDAAAAVAAGFTDALDRNRTQDQTDPADGKDQS